MIAQCGPSELLVIRPGPYIAMDKQLMRPGTQVGVVECILLRRLAGDSCERSVWADDEASGIDSPPEGEENSSKKQQRCRSTHQSGEITHERSHENGSSGKLF